MDVIQLLEYLQEIIETSAKVPVTGKVMVNKKEIIEVTEQIINYLPEEFKKAQWIVTEKERILGQASRDAEIIKKENIELLKKHIENHDITREAKTRAEEIISAAQRDAKIMRLGARDYADEILCQLEQQISEKGEAMVLKVKEDVEKFVLQLEKDANFTINTVRENIKELRNVK